jgi:surface-anchored protein
MKKSHAFLMLSAALSVALFASPAYSDCFQLTSEHADLRVTYNPGAPHPLGLTIFSEALERGFATNEITIVGGESSRLTLPPGTPFGPEGASLWVLPQTAQAGLPLLGTSGEGLPEGVFAENQVEIRLVRVDGPGHFLLWQTLGPGQFNILMDSRDGISATDISPIGVDAHKHHAWGFTTSGVYRLTFQAAATLSANAQPTVSAEFTFIFHLLPLRPWESWQATHWPCECNPQLIGPNADPDADGVINLGEYAQGSNPRAADARQRPRALVVWHNGQPYGALQYQRAKNATDVSVLPVMGPDFSGSNWQPMTLTHEVEDLGEQERITLRDSQPLNAFPRRWYQLRLQPLP